MIKNLTLILFIIPSLSFGQCDSIKRKAAEWVLQRNECRELLAISDSQIAKLEAMDSLNQLALDKYEHAVDILGKALVQSEADKHKAESERDKFKQRARRRLWLLPVGFVLGVITVLVV